MIDSAILQRKFWIFDLDGTLTVPAHDFAAIRTRLAVPPEADILGHIDLQPEEEQLRLRKLLDEIEDEVCANAAPAFGVHALMETLHRRGAGFGILTRNTREVALRTLAAIGIGEYFREEAIIGRYDAPPKPDPEGIFRLLERWGTSPESAVMVGDYLFDLQAGRAAGTATVHLDSSARFRWPELADVAVADASQLATMVMGD